MVVSEVSGIEPGLEAAIARVYAGPLDDFIPRRDTAAKELRAAGRRDDAAAIKALRKPSRAAWALNAAAREGEGAIESLIGAVAATLDAQAKGGDVRGAIADLRGAVRAFAATAARFAAHGGQRVDEATLGNAVLAVIGKPEDFTALRDGRLVDVPEAGGLDFLATLPPPPAVPARKAPAAAPAAKVRATEAPDPSESTSPGVASEPVAPKPGRARRAAPTADDVAARAAHQETVRRANAALAAARARAAVAQQKLGAVETRLAAAEGRLRQAEQDAVIMRGERDRAVHDAAAADAQMREAEAALAEAERRIEGS
jgi:hypothetical protein